MLIGKLRQFGLAQFGSGWPIDAHSTRLHWWLQLQQLTVGFAMAKSLCFVLKRKKKANKFYEKEKKNLISVKLSSFFFFLLISEKKIKMKKEIFIHKFIKCTYFRVKNKFYCQVNI